MEKNSYERRAYESVDDGNPFWVTSQKWTENKNSGSKGLKYTTKLNNQLVQTDGH